MEQTQERRNIRIINRDVLKYMALFMMGIGHLITFVGIQHFRFLPVPVLRFFVFGQMFAPPVFFFFISEGFVHTRSRKQYAMRLAAIALITQVPLYLCHSFTDGQPVTAMFTSWNIMTTLFLGLLVLMVWDSKWKLPVRIIVMILITGASYLINAEWKVFAPVLIFVFYILREKPVLRYCIYTVIMLCHQFICNGFMFWFSIRSFQWFIPEMIAITVITFLYNGKKGSSSKFSKWIFYVFYPAHLLLAFAIQMMLK